MTEPMDVEEATLLLPCPFCGGNDLMLGWVDGWQSVRCPTCHVTVEREGERPHKAWNSRAIDARLARDREVVRKVREEMSRMLLQSRDPRGDWQVITSCLALLDSILEGGDR